MLRQFVVILFVLGSRALYVKYTPNLDPEAVCLDGSPSILYVSQGTDPKKMLLYFLGGAVCAHPNGTAATI